MATHSSVLAWRIPVMGEPSGLPSMGSHRVRHDWSDLAVAAAATLETSMSLSQDLSLFIALTLSNSLLCSCHRGCLFPHSCFSPGLWQCCCYLPLSTPKMRVEGNSLNSRFKLMLGLRRGLFSVVLSFFYCRSCMDARVGLWRKLSAEELMLLNCGVGEDSWESLGLQGDPTSPS